MRSKSELLKRSAIVLFVVVQFNVVLTLHFDKNALKGQSVLYGSVAASVELGNRNSSNLCWRQLSEWKKALDEGKIWPLRVLDASGTPRAGFLYGNNYWIGDRANCKDLTNTRELEIDHNRNTHLTTDFDYPPYNLEFAVAYLRHNNIVQLHTGMALDNIITLGLCVPNSCESQDIVQLLQTYFNQSLLEFQKLHDMEIQVENVRILKLNFMDNFLKIILWPKTIAFLIMFSGTIFLVALGTIVDVRRKHRQKNLLLVHNLQKSSDNNFGKATNSTLELMNSMETIPEAEKECLTLKILQCFSFYSNTKALVKTTLPSDSIKSLHGLRFFSMLWVIAVHAVFYSVDFVDNIPYAFRLSEDFFGQVFSNSTYCVDTYLCVSGFLLAYLFFKSKHNQSPSTNTSVNHLRKLQEFGLMFINRMMRLTPSYLALILTADVLYAIHREIYTVVPTEKPDVMCDQYWWRNVLYINNLFPRSEMCLSWSWYLSIDTQGFVLSTFILILSTIYFKTAAGIIILGIIINVVAGSYTSYSIGYVPTMDQQLAFLDQLYDLPWIRLGPYFVGVIAGYILKVRLQDTLVLKERTRIILWILFPLLNMWIIFTLYTRKISVGYSAFYVGVSRTLWGVGIAWILIACATKNARLLEKFLSFKGFVPTSRLTYCAYLLNPLVMNLFYMAGESVYHASIANIALYCVAIACSTFVLAYVFSMLFESPFILLTKMMFNKIQQRTGSNVQQNNVNNHTCNGAQTTQSNGVTNHQTNQIVA